MKILIDSSVWIDYFSNGENSAKLDLLIDANLICTCGIILAELIPHLLLRQEKKLVNLLTAIPTYDVSQNWKAIIDHQYTCLKKGINKVGIADLQILDTAIKNKLSLFSLDKHFQLMHKYIDFNLFI